MSTSWVIKLPLAENAGEAVLVHISPKNGDDSDLDLLATDGESAFKGKGVRGRKISALRHKNYDGSNEEWSAILKRVLVSKQGSGVSDTIKSSLEVCCSISGNDPKATLSISLRTRVENITQRLGGIELAQTPDIADVDLFGWASLVIDRRDELEDQVTRERLEVGKSKDSIITLQAQLEDLVKAKAEHEAELLAKFAALLNEKKLRLRNLTRQMSTAKLDKRALDKLEEELPPSERKSSRGKKRPAPEAEQGGESDESDGFEAMDVDKPEHTKYIAAESDEERQTTDTATESETDNDDLDQPVASQIRSVSAGASKLPQKQQEESLPPPRELPFTRQAKQAEKPIEPSSPQDDDETASEDDEL